MAWTKMKTAAVAGAVVLLATGTGIVAVKTVHAVRTAKAPDIQGAWAGIWAGDIGQGKFEMPLMIKISRENGAYHAVGVDIYQGRPELPISKLVYNYPSIHIEQGGSGFVYDGNLNPKTMEMSGTWKCGNGSGPLTVKLNGLPEAFSEPLAESDYAPRNDSDLQGYWKGTLKVGHASLRMAFKIAERADKTFRVAWDNTDQGAENIEATAVAYQAPTVKVEFGGVGIGFEGRVDGTDRVITGNPKQGDNLTPLTLVRARPESAAVPDPAIEARKDYTYTSPNDLPGHWHGNLEIKQSGQKLRLELNIATLPDRKFFASMFSFDQGGVELPASSIQYAPPNVHLEWSTIGVSFIENLKMAKCPASSSKPGWRCRWFLKGTGPNDPGAGAYRTVADRGTIKAGRNTEHRKPAAPEWTIRCLVLAVGQ